MARFWAFPLVLGIAATLAHFVFLQIATVAFRISAALSSTDAYFHYFAYSVPPWLVLASILIGFVAAGFDWRGHRFVDSTGTASVRLLVLNLFWFWLASLLLCLSVYALQIGFETYISSKNLRRYHAYPPEMSVLNFLYRIPFFITMGALIWATIHTVRSREVASPRSLWRAWKKFEV